MNRRDSDSNMLLDQLEEIGAAFPTMQDDGPSPESIRLEKIRQLSNVIQALENLQMQCSDYESFEHIRTVSKTMLNELRQQMHRQIHND